ncbi:hypothetical protein LWI28_024046 [Acer negundo]|uniref:Uncharacterized protein n=1 Tax=Acer negundo TaxID=4023 RepID=A0AAD5NVG2_ACENE|nr:hypothetical protein LWI28_024046 [Acer negundo]
MELVSDVQQMLKGAMQFYSFQHEVRSEARKVHDLFFDILKIAFPDTDFREARNALSFSGPVSTSTSVPSPRLAAVGQSKRPKMINDMEPGPSPPQKPMLRGSISTGEDTRIRSHMPQKESRLGSGSGNIREQSQQDDSPHPGELVICKKKRKDREKSAVKTRTGSAGPVSPPSLGRNIRSPGPGSIPKDSRPTTHQQAWANQPSQPSNGGGGGTVGWANPVKRLRTDAGKRRPSQL